MQLPINLTVYSKLQAAEYFSIVGQHRSGFKHTMCLLGTHILNWLKTSLPVSEYTQKHYSWCNYIQWDKWAGHWLRDNGMGISFLWKEGALMYLFFSIFRAVMVSKMALGLIQAKLQYWEIKIACLLNGKSVCCFHLKSKFKAWKTFNYSSM